MPDVAKVYYIQYIGDKLYIDKDKIYNLVLFKGEYIQPNTLSTAEQNAIPYDYTEVEVNSIVEGIVLRKEIIVLDKVDNWVLDGFIKTIIGIDVFGDKTEVSGVVFELTHLRPSDKKGKILISSKYVFRTPISGKSGGYSGVVYAVMDEQLSQRIIGEGVLILTVNIIGRIVEEGKTGKVALIHPRGSKQANMVLSVKPDDVQPYNLLKEMKRTTVINRKDVGIINLEKILDLERVSGRIRELTIISPVKTNIYINSDGLDLFTSHNSYDDLSTMAEFSDTVVAMQSIAGDYILNIKDIYFTKSIKIDVGISGSSTIKNIFCIYDIEERENHAN